MHIFFTHIPKVAGTTFRNILINNFSHHHMDWSTRGNNIVATPGHFPFCSNREMNKIVSVSGHWLRYTNGMKTAFPDAKFVTFVRNPIDRLISLYKHIVRTWDPNLKFDEWVEDASRPEISNFQTRFIAGSCDVERAMDILEKEYFFVGKAELFDESMCLLKKALNDIDTNYTSLRVSNKSNTSIRDNPKYYSTIEGLTYHNKHDIALNDFVSNALLKKYHDKYGVVTDEELIKFKEGNKVFSFSQTNKRLFLIKKNLYYRPITYFVNG